MTIRTEARVRDCKIMICDVCGETGPIVADVLDDDPVLELARLDGWTTDYDERDVCPACAKKTKKRAARKERG